MPPADRGQMVLAWAFARLDTLAFVLASAAVFAAALAALTLAIVVKGAPPGVAVGPNLAQLAFYFPGYTVSVGGALLGAGYAALVGAAWGFVVAGLWNAAHVALLAVIRVRASLGAYSID
jgi:hypothetical protein